ncbi:MAG: VWA domain-containing protein, partial [Mycolicibacterium aromaticivorans]|nr:VWA domain-containing protein [Mycolicibacterium aromaticivorans]
MIFTDGGSNTGVDPIQAARIARSLGVRIYSVGVNT